jgi:predicted AlkP superfamily phosphohydrolase/phosphomutase
MIDSKIVFVELDGGSWNVIEPLIVMGKLPNMKKLMDGGVFCSLMSEPPLVSPKLWATIFTGKGPKPKGAQY